MIFFAKSKNILFKFASVFISLALSLLVSCSDDFTETVETDFSTTYTYYAYSPDDFDDVDSSSITYKIGDSFGFTEMPSVSSSEFFAMNPGYKIAGWVYYKNPYSGSTEIPENFQIEERDTQNNGTQQIVVGVSVTSAPAAFYVADWNPVTYYVAFNGNGNGVEGTMENQPFTYDVGASLSSNTFSRNGFTFKGWNYYANRNLTTAELADEATVKNLANRENEVVNLYACWLAENITITFDSNGGSGTMEAMTDVHVGTQLNSNTFTAPTGHHFGYWECTTSESKYFAYSDGEVFTESNYPNEDSTFYAYWAPDTYTLTFNSNSGSGSMESQTFTYGVSQALNANSFYRNGYNFTGWNTSSDGSGTSYSDGQAISVTGDTTLYAQWEAQVFTVSFSSNGGSGSMAAQSFTYSDSLSSSLSENTFTREGYTFTGWNTSSDGSGTSYSDGQTISSSSWLSSDITLYAQWSINTFTVTFNSNGGSSVETQTVAWGSTATLYVPSKAGSDFAGWYTDSSFASEFDFSTAIKQNYTLYARWNVQTLTVTFSGNGSTAGSVSDLSMTYGDSSSFPSNSYTKTGYNFLGWSTSSSADSADYPDGYMISTSNWISGTLNLYAVWEAVTYTVDFNANGGESDYSVTVNYGSTVSAPSNPTLTGYNFIGWYTDSSFASEFDFSTAIYQDYTLYAKYEAQTYTVTFDSTHGTGSMASQTFTYGVSQSLSECTFTRDGYNFAGWATSSSSTASVSYTDKQNISITSDLSLYAYWTTRGTVTNSQFTSITYNTDGITFNAPSTGSSYQWLLDGVVVSADQNYTIYYDDFTSSSTDKHTVVVLVYDDEGIPVVYSARFTVE